MESNDLPTQNKAMIATTPLGLERAIVSMLTNSSPGQDPKNSTFFKKRETLSAVVTKIFLEGELGLVEFQKLLN